MMRCPSTFLSIRLVIKTFQTLSFWTSSKEMGNSTLRGLFPERVGIPLRGPDFLKESMREELPPSHLASVFTFSV
jgi:hypothetical protein